MAPDSGFGIPGWVIALVVLVPVLGVALTIWRISLVRHIARNAGLNPNEAAAVSMLGNDGIGLAYVASALTLRPPHQPPQPVQQRKTAEERLAELQNLRVKGLVSNNEYEAQRTKILGSI